MVALRLGVLLAAGVLCTACTSEPPGEVPPAAPPRGCVAGERVLDDGSCQPAGVPEGACGEGFASDGLGGCVAPLPPAPCQNGQTALPGETACRDLKPCGSEPWDAGGASAALYVAADAAPGGDGSPAAPFTSIGAAHAAAQDGDTIAVAAGVYAEALSLGDKAVTLIGRCPAMVAIDGAGGGVTVSGARPVVMQGFALTGAGVRVSHGAVELADLWLHDLAGAGLFVASMAGPASVAARNLRVERAADVGALVLGASLVLEDFVISATAPLPDGRFDRGIDVERIDGLDATLEARRGVVEGSREHGIYVSGAQASIDSVLVRDTAFHTQSDPGRGITVHELAADLVRSPSRPRARSRSRGCSRSPAIHDVSPSPAPGLAGIGFGMSLQVSAANGALPVTVATTLVERAHAIGIAVFGGDATLDGCWVRDTLPNPVDGRGGRGINVQALQGLDALPALTVRNSRVQRSVDVGIAVFDTSPAVIERTAVDGVAPSATDGRYGDGIDVYGTLGAVAPSSVIVRESSVSGAARAGVGNFAATVVVGASQFACNPIHLNGEKLDRDFSYDDQGGNTCGCGDEAATCQVLSAELLPPAPEP